MDMMPIRDYQEAPCEMHCLQCSRYELEIENLRNAKDYETFISPIDRLLSHVDCIRDEEDRKQVENLMNIRAYLIDYLGISPYPMDDSIDEADADADDV